MRSAVGSARDAFQKAALDERIDGAVDEGFEHARLGHDVLKGDEALAVLAVLAIDDVHDDGLVILQAVGQSRVFKQARKPHPRADDVLFQIKIGVHDVYLT